MIHVINTMCFPSRERMYSAFPKHAIGAEIGVFEGKNALNLHKITQPDYFYLVDIWPQQKALDNTKSRFKNKPNVFLIQEDSRDFLFSIDNNYFDWVYLDSSHEYQQTYQELKLLNFKVKPDGIIAGHDYCSGNIANGTKYGVIEAVNKFMLEYNWRMKYFAFDPLGHFSYAIERNI